MELVKIYFKKLNKLAIIITFLALFLFLFLPPGSGSAYWIRIRILKPIYIQNLALEPTKLAPGTYLYPKTRPWNLPTVYPKTQIWNLPISKNSDLEPTYIQKLGFGTYLYPKTRIWNLRVPISTKHTGEVTLSTGVHVVIKIWKVHIHT